MGRVKRLLGRSLVPGKKLEEHQGKKTRGNNIGQAEELKSRQSWGVRTNVIKHFHNKKRLASFSEVIRIKQKRRMAT